MTNQIQISKRLDDGTILVIGGETVDEFRKNADAFVGSGAADVAALFYELIPASAGSKPATTSGHSPEVVEAVQNLNNSGLRTEEIRQDKAFCQHGEMEWREFTSKAGNDVRGHFCQSKAGRDSECKPQYAARARK